MPARAAAARGLGLAPPYAAKGAMTGYPRLILMRHGQTVWNAAGRMQGRLDSPLTVHGRRQATAMGRVVAALLPDGRADLFVSPSGRTMQTADIALTGMSWPRRQDPRLMELGVGRFEGMTRDEITHEYPAIEQGPDFAWLFAAPGGEGLDRLRTRVRDFLADLAKPADLGRAAVIVSHGITLRLLRAEALGLGVTGYLDLPGGQGVVWEIAAGHHRVHTV